MQPLEKVRAGFSSLQAPAQAKEAALSWIGRWLSEEQFSDYAPQIAHLIGNENWHYLLDAFYQVIPFGTGGRRGPMGIGPNRINYWTVQASAQGHSQYLLGKHGEGAKERGVVLAYDVRQYDEEPFFSRELSNPARGMTSRKLALAAAEVYVANGITVHIFPEVRTTPELSFAIRHLRAVSGDMFSASHNPPTDSGKKVYDEHGGQLIPPYDQELVEEVERVTEVLRIPFEQAERNGLVKWIGKDVDDAYLSAVGANGKSPARGVRIVFSPLHGTGSTSVHELLLREGFETLLDPRTSSQSGRFENVTFNIPNPEVVESFDASLPFASERGADLVVSADPDADRIGLMVRHGDTWRYLNGNEIGILLASYGLSKFDGDPARATIVKTLVTSSLIERMARRAGVRCIGDLLVGFKYVGNVMNDLEREGGIGGFIVALEESHGFLGGNYARDKDAAFAALWIAELASELKRQGLTLVDRLDGIYAEQGYCHNYLTEIRLLGAEGSAKIAAIQGALRERLPARIGEHDVVQVIDRWKGPPHVSPTDTASRDVLRFVLSPMPGVSRASITVRPSGTEPKIKFYFEALGEEGEDLDGQKRRLSALVGELERAFLDVCYGIIGVSFPGRGYLLFPMLPLADKLRYFEIEGDIARLRDAPKAGRAQRLARLLSFLGANPIEKVDAAFRAEHGKGIREYLSL